MFASLLLGLTGLAVAIPASAAAPSAAPARRFHWDRDASTGHGTLRTNTSETGAVVRVTVHNPPINLYDQNVAQDMYSFMQSISPKEPGIDVNNNISWPKVVIFSSDIKDFWIGSYDINLLGSTNKLDNATTQKIFTETVATTALVRSLPSIFIAEINGRATGSGNEFLVTCDMSFAGPDTVVGMVETAVGNTEGNGGVQYMVRRMGMHRAAEYLLPSQSIGPQEAAEVGWVNRAYDSAEELSQAVDAIANRMALLPAGSLNATKTAIRAFGPSQQQITDDLNSVNRLFAEEKNILPVYLSLSQNQSANAFMLNNLRSLTDLKQLVEQFQQTIN
jgi:enoyl-CoA hydratase/carnithine racemase